MQSEAPREQSERWALSVRNIRKETLVLVLLYPVVLCAGDLMSAYRDFAWLGMDSVALQGLASALPCLLCALFFRAPSMRLTRLCAYAMLLTVPAMAVLPLLFNVYYDALEMIPCLLFHLAYGYCAVAVTYVMMFRLNNAERLAALLIWSLGYGLQTVLRPLADVFLPWGYYALAYSLAGLLSGVLVIVLRCVGTDALAQPWIVGAKARETESASAGHLPIACYAVFLLLILFELFVQLLNGLIGNSMMTNAYASGLGTLVAAAILWAIHRFFQNGGLIAWSLFLAAMTGCVLSLLGRTFAAHSVANALFAAGETFGLVAVMYMVLGIGKSTGRIAFFRGYCGLTFALAAVSPLLTGLNLDALSQSTLVLALAAVAVCLLATVLVAPVLQRALFTAEWADAFRRIDMELARETVELASREEYPDLTPREREVCALLLCGKTMRQIGGELSISPSTVSFHCHGLYQKLGVASRAELFAKFSDRLTLSS